MTTRLYYVGVNAQLYWGAVEYTVSFLKEQRLFPGRKMLFEYSLLVNL